MLPTTVDRVPNQTSEAVNERIRRQTEQRIGQLKQAGPAAIARRLEELDAEWDIERTLEANAATASLIGVTLGPPSIADGSPSRQLLARFCFSMPCKVGARRYLFSGDSDFAQRLRSTLNGMP